MITITVETDDEERAIRVAFHDGTLFRAVRPAFAIKRDGRDVGGMAAALIEGGPRETYISADGPPGLAVTIGIGNTGMPIQIGETRQYPGGVTVHTHSGPDSRCCSAGTVGVAAMNTITGSGGTGQHYQPHPRDANGHCLCLDACCNQMRYADDGDGHVDAMPERNICPDEMPRP